MKTTKRPAKKVLEPLALGVGDIVNEFGLIGFSRSEDIDRAPAQESLPGLEGAKEHGNQELDNGIPDEDGETDEIYEQSRTFEREDIEVGIDLLISRMVKKKLIDKDKTGRQPTLWRVFNVVYGESHPIVELVESFEQHIKGYFGTIDYEEMQSAFDKIIEIQRLIQRDLEAAND